MKDKKGFTLVELLAVIAILAILVIIALPNVINMYNNAKKQVFLTEAQTVASTSEKKFLTGSITEGSKETVYCKSKTDEKNPLEMTGEKKYYYVQLASDGTTNKLIIWDDQKYIKYVSDGSKEISDLTVDEVVERDNSDFTCGNVLSKIGVNDESQQPTEIIPDKNYAVKLSISGNVMTISLNSATGANFDKVNYVVYKTDNYSSVDYTKDGETTSNDKANSFKTTYNVSIIEGMTSYKVIAYTTTGNKISEETYTSSICFVAGTKVLTENGYKNIEDIKVGDMVYSYNLDNNEKELKKVTRTIKSSTEETYIVTINGKKVEMSPRHYVYIVDKGWVRAYDLKVGDKMLSSDKKVIDITNIERKNYEGGISTYNLTVDGNSNYYVSEIQVLVHNAPSVTVTN